MLYPIKFLLLTNDINFERLSCPGMDKVILVVDEDDDILFYRGFLGP